MSGSQLEQQQQQQQHQHQHPLLRLQHHQDIGDQVGFDNTLKEKCREGWLREGFKALVTWASIAAVTSGALSLWPAFRQRINWRGQLFIVSSLGIAGFWVKGEESLQKCKHSRDAQRIKDLREGKIY